MRKLWLTLTMTAVFVGSAAMPVTPIFAASSDNTPDGTYTMDLSEDGATEGDVEGDTYGDDSSLDDIDPALLDEFYQFDTYLGELGSLLDYSDKAWATYNTNEYVSSANRKQEYQMMTYTVIPNYIKFVAGLKQIKPQNAELAKIHAQYVKGASAELEAFKLYKKYVSSTQMNKVLLKKAQALLTTGNTLVEQYYSDMDQYQVRFEPLYEYENDESYEDDGSYEDDESYEGDSSSTDITPTTSLDDFV
ncbi:hypothetical protein [Paenibacillus wenxiniae]|uniref:Uncharacterized protein n=1 Tax=Paenibacillus wenxiniae TaxID=1636843 RepID=A0ABW4REZ9_9BACL